MTAARAMAGTCRRRVLIVQRRLTSYRVALFEKLREALVVQAIDLHLATGQATPDEEAKRDGGRLDWAHPLRTRYYMGSRLCWQPLGPVLDGADLVIVAHENKLIYNHWLVVRPRRFRLAFWGHGRNWQAREGGWLRERFKRWEARRVDWWFAYTQRSVRAIEESGFPQGRITNLNNAIDTRALTALGNSVSQEELDSTRRDVGLAESPVGVYLGSLYREKRLGFLLEAAGHIRNLLPNFRLLIIGDGPERETVARFAAAHDWVLWRGALSGREKALHLLLGDVLLMPGLVGLSILDAFALERPMVTTAWRFHSPEIEYLEDGTNGLITPDNPVAYAQSVAALVIDRERLMRLRAGCRESAAVYTLDAMVSRFADGIRSALESR